MDMDKIAQERIEELEQQNMDLHVLVDLKEEEISDLKMQLKLAVEGLKHARSAMKVEVA